MFLFVWLLLFVWFSRTKKRPCSCNLKDLGFFPQSPFLEMFLFLLFYLTREPTWRQRKPYRQRTRTCRSGSFGGLMLRNSGCFGPTLAQRERQARIPQQPGRWSPRSLGQREHPRVVVGTDPPHIRCLQCGLRAVHANGHPRWAYLRNRGGCRNPPGKGAAPAAPIRNYAGGAAPAAPIGKREVEPLAAGVG